MKSRAFSQWSGRRAHLPRDREIRIREHRRLLPLTARRSAAQLHRYDRRSAALDGIPKRKGSPRGCALAVEINYNYAEVWLPPTTSALQTDLPPGGAQYGLDRMLPAETRCRCQRQRHATNVSISKGGKNLFWDPKGEEQLSKAGWEFVDRILTHGNDICLLLNPASTPIAVSIRT